MLDAVISFLPSPLDIAAIDGHKVGDEDVEILRQPSDDEPFSALAFKIMTDPHLGKTHLRAGVLGPLADRYPGAQQY